MASVKRVTRTKLRSLLREAVLKGNVAQQHELWSELKLRPGDIKMKGRDLSHFSRSIFFRVAQDYTKPLEPGEVSVWGYLLRSERERVVVMTGILALEFHNNAGVSKIFYHLLNPALAEKWHGSLYVAALQSHCLTRVELLERWGFNATGVTREALETVESFRPEALIELMHLGLDPMELPDGMVREVRRYINFSSRWPAAVAALELAV